MNLTTQQLIQVISDPLTSSDDYQREFYLSCFQELKRRIKESKTSEEGRDEDSRVLELTAQLAVAKAEIQEVIRLRLNDNASRSEAIRAYHTHLKTAQERIAELMAELAVAKDEVQQVSRWHLVDNKTHAEAILAYHALVKTARERIAELEAERKKSCACVFDGANYAPLTACKFHADEAENAREKFNRGIAAERADCALLCENEADSWAQTYRNSNIESQFRGVAARIRKRGEVPAEPAAPFTVDSAPRPEIARSIVLDWFAPKGSPE